MGCSGFKHKHRKQNGPRCLVLLFGVWGYFVAILVYTSKLKAGRFVYELHK